MTLRIDPEKREILNGLLSEPGFRDLESVISFALAIGIFFNRSSSWENGTGFELDVTEMDIWPMVQLIIHDRHPKVEDMANMNEVLQGYLLGGIDMISEKLSEKKGIGALEAIEPLMPP